MGPSSRSAVALHPGSDKIATTVSGVVTASDADGVPVCAGDSEADGVALRVVTSAGGLRETLRVAVDCTGLSLGDAEGRFEPDVLALADADALLDGDEVGGGALCDDVAKPVGVDTADCVRVRDGGGTTVADLDIDAVRVLTAEPDGINVGNADGVAVADASSDRSGVIDEVRGVGGADASVAL